MRILLFIATSIIKHATYKILAWCLILNKSVTSAILDLKVGSPTTFLLWMARLPLSWTVTSKKLAMKFIQGSSSKNQGLKHLVHLFAWTMHLRQAHRYWIVMLLWVDWNTLMSRLFQTLIRNHPHCTMIICRSLWSNHLQKVGSRFQKTNKRKAALRISPNLGDSPL